MLSRQTHLSRREVTVGLIVNLAAKQDSTTLATEVVAGRLGVTQVGLGRPPKGSWVDVSELASC